MLDRSAHRAPKLSHARPRQVAHDVDKSAKPKPAEIGKMLERRFRFLHVDGTLHCYAGGVYAPNGEEVARRETQRILGADSTSRDGTEVCYWLSHETAKTADALDKQCINVKNGLLDPRAGRLIPHTPDRLHVIQYPVDWRADAYCERVDRFLDEVMPADGGETRALLMEFVGYILTTDCRYEKCLTMEGSGANGKSKLIEMLIAMLGRENVSNVGLQEFDKSRFKAAQLAGKVANIYPELSDEALEGTQFFKALVSGDFIDVERKGQQSFQYKNRAKLIFSANKLPRSKDRSDGFYRRHIIIPFPNRFPEGDPRRDPNLSEKLTRPEGLSYLMRLAVEGLGRLIARKGFAPSRHSAAALTEYRSANDPVYAFVTERCKVGPDETVIKDQVYFEYEKWARENDRKAWEKGAFYKRLKGVVPDLEERRPRVAGESRLKMYHGIRILGQAE